MGLGFVAESVAIKLRKSNSIATVPFNWRSRGTIAARVDWSLRPAAVLFGPARPPNERLHKRGASLPDSAARELVKARTRLVWHEASASGDLRRLPGVDRAVATTTTIQSGRRLDRARELVS